MLPPVPYAPADPSTEAALPAAAGGAVSAVSYLSFFSAALLWLCFLSVLPNPSLAEECISPTALPKSCGRLKKQREEGRKKNEHHILRCCLCLLGLPLALIPLSKDSQVVP